MCEPINVSQSKTTRPRPVRPTATCSGGAFSGRRAYKTSVIAPATSMLSAKLKIAQSKPIGVDVEVDEVADVPERQPVVAIAHRAGHDQAQGDGEDPARGRSQHEQVIEDHDRRDDREAGEDQAAAGYVRPEAPERTRVLTGVKLEDRAARSGSVEPGAGRPSRKRSTWSPDRTRSRPGRSTRREGAGQDPRLPSVFIRSPPASVHSRCNAGRKGSPEDAAWRSARRTPRIARTSLSPFGSVPRRPARASPARSRSGPA